MNSSTTNNEENSFDDVEEYLKSSNQLRYDYLKYCLEKSFKFQRLFEKYERLFYKYLDNIDYFANKIKSQTQKKFKFTKKILRLKFLTKRQIVNNNRKEILNINKSLIFNKFDNILEKSKNSIIEELFMKNDIDRLKGKLFRNKIENRIRDFLKNNFLSMNRENQYFLINDLKESILNDSTMISFERMRKKINEYQIDNSIKLEFAEKVPTKIKNDVCNFIITNDITHFISSRSSNNQEENVDYITDFEKLGYKIKIDFDSENNQEYTCKDWDLIEKLKKNQKRSKQFFNNINKNSNRIINNSEIVFTKTSQNQLLKDNVIKIVQTFWPGNTVNYLSEEFFIEVEEEFNKNKQIKKETENERYHSCEESDSYQKNTNNNQNKLIKNTNIYEIVGSKITKYLRD